MLCFLRLPRWVLAAAVIILIHAVAGLGLAQESAEDAAETAAQAAGDGPAWVVYQDGVQQLRARDLGAAMEAFRRAIRLRGSPFPEAEAGIGRVFSAEGQTDLAERQFRRALANSDAFDIPHTAYSVRYELAELYLMQERNRRAYQEILTAIVEDDRSFSADENQSLKRAYRDTLQRAGINRLLVLYRLEENFAGEAHRRLGEHYLESRNMAPAADHLMYATLMIFSTAIAEYRRENPSYEFSTLSDFFARIERHEAIRAYLSRSRLYRILYNLGTSLYGADLGSQTPRQLWRFLAAREDAGRFGRLAGAQLRDPSLERAVVY